MINRACQQSSLEKVAMKAQKDPRHRFHIIQVRATHRPLPKIKKLAPVQTRCLLDQVRHLSLITTILISATAGMTTNSLLSDVRILASPRFRKLCIES